MKITGELIDNQIIIKKPKEVGRLYNKSNLGETTTGNHLILQPLEALLLIEENKIQLYHHKKPITFQHLFKIGSQHNPNLLNHYLVFKDLRHRGLHIKPATKKKDITFHYTEQQKNTKPKTINICVFSERDPFNIKTTHHQLTTHNQDNQHLWYAIVDTEGDITYYKISQENLKGTIPTQQYPQIKAYYHNNRILIFDQQTAHMLFQNEFYGKPLEKGLQLSIIEGLYLQEKKILQIFDLQTKQKLTKTKLKNIMEKNLPDLIEQYTIFSDLKKRNLIVKTGFKFGAHFRAYTQKPDKTHAEYLIHTSPEKYKAAWSEISRAIRLAHSVNKEIFFAFIQKNKISYIQLGRLRP